MQITIKWTKYIKISKWFFKSFPILKQKKKLKTWKTDQKYFFSTDWKGGSKGQQGNQLSFDELSFDELPFDELPFDELSFDELSFDELSFDKLSFDQLTHLQFEAYFQKTKIQTNRHNSTNHKFAKKLETLEH